MDIEIQIEQALKDQDMSMFNGKKKLAEKKKRIRKKKPESLKEIEEIIKESENLFEELKTHMDSSILDDKNVQIIIPMLFSVFTAYQIPESLHIIFQLGQLYYKKNHSEGQDDREPA
jgi:hypothetical protein